MISEHCFNKTCLEDAAIYPHWKIEFKVWAWNYNSIFMKPIRLFINEIDLTNDIQCTDIPRAVPNLLIMSVTITGLVRVEIQGKQLKKKQPADWTFGRYFRSISRRCRAYAGRPRIYNRSPTRSFRKNTPLSPCGRFCEPVHQWMRLEYFKINQTSTHRQDVNFISREKKNKYFFRLCASL